MKELIAFYFDIEKVLTVGQIPYVSFIHEISELNTIYKPLQKMSRDVREYVCMRRFEI